MFFVILKEEILLIAQINFHIFFLVNLLCTVQALEQEKVEEEEDWVASKVFSPYSPATK